MSQRNRLVVFAKAPVPGAVKTRLSPALSPDAAAEFYAASLDDVVVSAVCATGSVDIWYAGDGGYFEQRFPEIPRARQPAGDLGTRLMEAFDRTFAAGADRVSVIGSDAPTLPRPVLAGAFHALDRADAALGPTEDGGYYLVAVRRDAWPRAKVLFREIAWSTDEVLDQTRARASAATLGVALLPLWYDIDRAEDLVRARQDAAADSRLGAWLRERPHLTAAVAS